MFEGVVDEIQNDSRTPGRHHGSQVGGFIAGLKAFNDGRRSTEVLLFL